jgi:hypothetical protein
VSTVTKETIMATRKKNGPTPARSPKALRPPQEAARPPRVKRRDKTAHGKVRKDTMILQTDEGSRARWSGSRPAWKKR